MTDLVRQQVVGYLLGALDDSEMEEVRGRLKSDPSYRHAMRLARRDMCVLQRLQAEVPVPRRLAERTCMQVLDPVERLRAAKLRKAMTPAPVPASRPRRFHRADAIVAGVILFIAGLLVLPAVSGSRFQSRLATCQDNLRNVGVALGEYSDHNDGAFPAVPVEGNLAADGIWAPVLKDEGYLEEPQKVLCPESPQAAEADFHIPSLDELRRAAGDQVAGIQQKMGGSYGYCLGFVDNGRFEPTRNLGRDYFAILADAPSDRDDHQSMNHGGVGQNVLFEDLHVEFCNTTRPGDGRDDIYTNDNHQVAPGLHRDDSVIAPSGTPPIVLVNLPQ